MDGVTRERNVHTFLIVRKKNSKLHAVSGRARGVLPGRLSTRDEVVKRLCHFHRLSVKMSTATVSVLPVERPSVGSESDGSGSDDDAGRYKVKSAVVQATSQATRKEAKSPSSSLSRTPSPLPHDTLPIPARRSPAHFPSSRRRPHSRSPIPPPHGWRRPRSPRYPRDGGGRGDRGGKRGRSRSPPRAREAAGELEEGELREQAEPQPKKKKEDLDPLLTRTGGAYIPPAKLRMMQAQIQDKSSVAYQKLAWEALKKSINGLINKVNVSNIGNIVQELFQENIVRGRGLLVRSVIQAQAASPTFTQVYAALVAVINTKFPQTGELLAKRLVIQFKKGFRRNDKAVCVTASKFLAHLVNQMVLHEIVALELLTLLLEEPTDDSVEVAVGFIKDIGEKLTKITPRGMVAVFETLRSVLHSKQVNSRVQYMIEVMFAVRKDKFQDYPAIPEGLDLVQEDDQITHLLSLSDAHDGEDLLNVFQEDSDYLANEDKYKEIKAEILGEGSSGEEESSGDESDDEESEEDEEGEGAGAEGKIDIMDKTDSKALILRRTIYLTIMSSLDYEECAHKLLKTKEDGQEPEIAMMLVECCSQERSYLRFYGLLGQVGPPVTPSRSVVILSPSLPLSPSFFTQRFCLLSQGWVEAFDGLFQEQYATVHRLETNKLRNVAKFFAQLFYCDALPWTGMSCIHLNEEETNSSSRIFVKILFQELSEFMGLLKLNERLRDPILSEAFEGLLPRDNPKNTRFAINFFTSIGLGGLTDDLREHLKDVQKQIMAQKQEVSSSDTDSSEDSDDDSESDSSEEDSESEEDDESSESSSSGDSEEERKRRRKRREKEKEEERGRGREREKRDRGEERKERGKERERGGEDKRDKRDKGRREGGEEDGRRQKRGEEEKEKDRRKEHKERDRDKDERREKKRHEKESGDEDGGRSRRKKKDQSHDGDRDQEDGEKDGVSQKRKKRDHRDREKGEEGRKRKREGRCRRGRCKR
ncbi:Pre-mRNA-splicing factor CWC22 homolog [Geodia barretti]|uniref:Pre-mRNA-splicing factor CWC22 homolog n=1 Tax=Geodia barretti TaxID=519541 RepID=A0AA35TJ48_GEOBA|nr:Pre-mRNA-splicing factor CWC22 homolog [Geodia barretti]